MIRKAVVPAAGLGTRLLPATKEQPKEMLPIFGVGEDNRLCLKPFIHIVFDSLYESGFREFCFVVGRGKRSIEEYFTADGIYLRYLDKRDRSRTSRELKQFYDRVEDSTISFVNQAEPRGFGHAVRLAKGFTGKEAFVVHAGDDLVMSRNGGYVKRMIEAFERHKADAVLCVERVKNPERYGVIQGVQISRDLYHVKRIEEKPKKPKSSMAVVAAYVFGDGIYDCLDKVKIRMGSELQLTSGIQQSIDEGGNVYAVRLGSHERRIDIGTPWSYWAALDTSRKLGMRIIRSRMKR